MSVFLIVSSPCKDVLVKDLPYSKGLLKERTDSGSGLAIIPENEDELEPIPFGDENRSSLV